MQSSKDVTVGQHFTWCLNTDNRTSGSAVVTAIKTDSEEGLSPEIEDFAAIWIEVKGTGDSRDGESFTIMLGTDSQYYLDGQKATISALPTS